MKPTIQERVTAQLLVDTVMNSMAPNSKLDAIHQAELKDDFIDVIMSRPTPTNRVIEAAGVYVECVKDFHTKRPLEGADKKVNDLFEALSEALRDITDKA